MKRLVKTALANPRVWRAARPFRATGLAVLTYHRIGECDPAFRSIPTGVFREQLEWLSTNCEVLDPDAIAGRPDARVRGRLPVLITFDDGYRCYHDHAYPVLQRVGVHAVNFLPTGYLDSSAPFWWDLLDAAVRASTGRRATVPGTIVTLELDDAGRMQYARACKQALKAHAAPDRSPLFDDALKALGFDRTTVPIQRQVMTWDEARAAASMTCYGGHGHSHPIMSLLEEAEIAAEASLCRDRMTAELGVRPRLFAYPSGAHNDSARRATACAGYDVAFTTKEGFNTGGIDWMAVERMHAPATVADLAWLLSGWSR